MSYTPANRGQRSWCCTRSSDMKWNSRKKTVPVTCNSNSWLGGQDESNSQSRTSGEHANSGRYCAHVTTPSARLRLAVASRWREAGTITPRALRWAALQLYEERPFESIQPNAQRRNAGVSTRATRPSARAPIATGNNAFRHGLVARACGAAKRSVHREREGGQENSFGWQQNSTAPFSAFQCARHASARFEEERKLAKG